MTITELAAFNLALLAALASPGPALLYAIRSSVAGGRGAGLLAGLGLAAMAAVWTGLALLGLEGLFRLVPWAYVAIKTLGALYLLWIAWQAWASADSPIADTARPAARDFWGGVMVNAANPKSVLFSGAVIVVIFPEGLAPLDQLTIVVNHFAVELIAYSALAMALSQPAARSGYLRLKSVLDRIAGAVLGFLGVRLLIER